MDEAKAVLHLQTLFPYKSEENLRAVYRQKNCNLSATIEALNNNGISTNRNILCSFVNGFRKLCGCLNVEENLQEETIFENQAFKLNIGDECAKNLLEQFSDSSLALPTGFEPIVEIPVGLGRQLYQALIESFFRQQEEYNQIISNCIKEDEEFARQLQDYEDQVLTKKDDLFEPSVIYVKPQEDFTDAKSSAKFYRAQAEEYHIKRKDFYEKARYCLTVQNYTAAKFYFEEAKNLTELIQEANASAAAAFLEEHKKGKHTIDLHNLYVKEAIEALDDFLEKEISYLRNRKLNRVFLTVITGRGKHSPDGIPKIKLAVIDYLKKENLIYREVNPGCLRVEINQNLLLEAN